MLAIMAHNCMFEGVMKLKPLTYLLHLLYFRSSHCEKKISWIHLGIDSKNIQFVDADLPRQSLSVTRTFAFAILYMSFNILLSLAAVASLRELMSNENNLSF